MLLTDPYAGIDILGWSLLISLVSHNRIIDHIRVIFEPLSEKLPRTRPHIVISLYSLIVRVGNRSIQWVLDNKISSCSIQTLVTVFLPHGWIRPQHYWVTTGFFFKFEWSISEVVVKGLIFLEWWDLLEVDFELGHSELSLQHVLFRPVPLNHFASDLPFLIMFRLHLELISLILFLILLIVHDFFQVFIDLGICYVVEDVGDRLGLMVHNHQLALVFLAPALKQHT